MVVVTLVCGVDIYIANTRYKPNIMLENVFPSLMNMKIVGFTLAVQPIWGNLGGCVLDWLFYL